MLKFIKMWDTNVVMADICYESSRVRTAGSRSGCNKSSFINYCQVHPQNYKNLGN